MVRKTVSVAVTEYTCTRKGGFWLSGHCFIRDNTGSYGSFDDREAYCSMLGATYGAYGQLATFIDSKSDYQQLFRYFQFYNQTIDTSIGLRYWFENKWFYWSFQNRTVSFANVYNLKADYSRGYYFKENIVLIFLGECFRKYYDYSKNYCVNIKKFSLSFANVNCDRFKNFAATMCELCKCRQTFPLNV